MYDDQTSNPIELLINQLEEGIAQEENDMVCISDFFPKGSIQLNETATDSLLSEFNRAPDDYDYAMDFPGPPPTDEGLFFHILTDGRVIFDHIMWSGTSYVTPKEFGEEGLKKMLESMLLEQKKLNNENRSKRYLF